jgi:hypothetical protein
MNWKLYLCIFFILIGILKNDLFAQVGFGLRAGGNMSYITLSGYSIKPGFHAGGFGKLPLTKFLYLQPEIVFSQKGGQTPWTSKKKYYNPFTQELYKREIYTLNYVDFNLLLRFNIWKGFHALAGPQFSIVVQDLFKYNNGYKEHDTYNNSNARKLDVGFHAGAAYELRNGIIFALRGDIGLLKILSEYNSKNLVASVSIGYTIMGKRVKWPN